MKSYRRDLEDLANRVEAGTGLQFEKERGLENIINSVVEAQELMDIYAGLKNREDTHLKELLRKFIGGTALRIAMPGSLCGRRPMGWPPNDLLRE